MNIPKQIMNKRTTNEDDFNISITDEHDDQDITTIGDPGKSYGIMSIMNLPHPNFSLTNKNRILNKQYDTNYNKDNFSTYTSMRKIRNDDSILNDEMYTEVRIILLNFFSIEDFWRPWNRKKLRKKKFLNYLMKNIKIVRILHKKLNKIKKNWIELKEKIKI